VTESTFQIFPGLPSHLSFCHRCSKGPQQIQQCQNLIVPACEADGVDQHPGSVESGHAARTPSA